jgi:hypothetical protein
VGPPLLSDVWGTWLDEAATALLNSPELRLSNKIIALEQTLPHSNIMQSKVKIIVQYCIIAVNILE